MPPFRVLVTGSRRWTDADRLKAVLDRIYNETTLAAGRDLHLCHGAARHGADNLTAWWVWTMGQRVQVLEFLANWELYGRRAGLIRNEQMLREFKPDLVLAFRASGRSNGTDHMINLARAAGVTTLIVSS